MDFVCFSNLRARFCAFFLFFFKRNSNLRDSMYLGDAKLYEKYDDKNILARAHFPARAGRKFCLLGQNLMIFQFSQRYEVWSAPRAQVRARQIFFYECKLCSKISLQFFWFVHSSKSEDFRAIWSLVIFLKKKSFFTKKHEFQMRLQ